MLQAINDHIKGWLGIFIVVLIGLPFAFWGIQDYVSGGSAQFAAKVNDTEISDREFEFSFSRLRQQTMEKFGGQLPFDEAILKQQTVEQLVNKYVVDHASQESGYRISDQALSQKVMSLFGDSGSFDREMYENRVRSSGQTLAQFEHSLRSELRVMQLRDGIMNTALVSDHEARQLVQLSDQERTIKLVEFKLSDYSEDVSITDEEINSKYQVQSASYMNPEKVSVQYVELTGESLVKDESLDEAKITEMYDAYVANISQREKRKARHILLNIDGEKSEAVTKLNDIRQQLLSGASFEELAEQHSDDIGSAKQGGDLGWIEVGQMVKPFEDALYALNAGELSEIVETSFGLHLIKLEQLMKQTPEPLSEKREQFEAELRQDAISNMFFDMSEQLATLAYENPDNLEVVNEVMGLELKTSELFSRASGSGIASNELVRKAAFAPDVINNNANSDIIELAPDHVVVLRVQKHELASQKPLEEVRSTIEASLRMEKAGEQAMDAAKAARTRLEQGESLDMVVDSETEIKSFEAVKRSGTTGLDRAVSNEVFSMPHPEDDKPVVREVAMLTGDVALVVLEQVTTPDNIEQSKIDMMKQQWKSRLAQSEFEAVLLSLRASAEVRINPKVIE